MSPFERRILGWKGHSDQAPSGDWLLNSVASAVFLLTSQFSIKEMSQGRETNHKEMTWNKASSKNKFLVTNESENFFKKVIQNKNRLYKIWAGLVLLKSL